jgi:hypothetical protein
MQALSQLSYGPQSGKSSVELEVSRPLDPGSLLVTGRCESQLNRRTADRHRGRKEITLIKLGAIRRDRIDLAGSVATVDVPLPTASRPPASDDDDLTVPNCPLALDPRESHAQIEDEVVLLVVQRTSNAKAKLRDVVHDHGLGGQSLLVCRQLAQHDPP